MKIFAHQGETCVKYLKNFENVLEDDDCDDLDIESFAKDSILRRLFRIKQEKDRKDVLSCLENLVESKNASDGISDDEKDSKGTRAPNFIVIFAFYISGLSANGGEGESLEEDFKKLIDWLIRGGAKVIFACIFSLDLWS